eukprot:3797617-Amphidinium_carterae.1
MYTSDVSKRILWMTIQSSQVRRHTEIATQRPKCVANSATVNEGYEKLQASNSVLSIKNYYHV